MTTARRVLLCTVITLINSSVLPAQPALADSIRAQEWIVGALDLTVAHRYSEGRGVVVAVIDTGVDASHADLTGNVLVGTDVSTGAPSGDGRTDTDGHGTGIAGLIAGHGHGAGGANGVVGIAPRAKILPVRKGGSMSFQIAPAIRWATEHDASIICIAAGSVGSSPDVAAAITEAETADVIVVAGVGNTTEGFNSVAYPAADPGVVAAAGTDEHGEHATVSVAGSQVVLAAPATNVVQPYPHHGYSIGTGTSISTAIIAGAAALVRARFPNLSAAEVIHRLTATAIDKGAPGRDDEYGYGLINIVAALTANVPPLSASPTVAPSPSSPTPAPTTPTASATADRSSSRGDPWRLIALMVAVLLVLAVFLVARRTIRRD